MAAKGCGGGGANGEDAGAGEGSGVEATFGEVFEEQLDGVGAGEAAPGVAAFAQAVDGFAERAGVGDGLDFDGGEFDGNGTLIGEQLGYVNTTVT